MYKVYYYQQLIGCYVGNGVLCIYIHMSCHAVSSDGIHGAHPYHYRDGPHARHCVCIIRVCRLLCGSCSMHGV